MDGLKVKNVKSLEFKILAQSTIFEKQGFNYNRLLNAAWLHRNKWRESQSISGIWFNSAWSPLNRTTLNGPFKAQKSSTPFLSAKDLSIAWHKTMFEEELQQTFLCVLLNIDLAIHPSS